MDEFLKLVHRQSRDNARTPMQWNNKINAGFSGASPWLRVNPNYEKINVENQENDPNSILNFYRKMIAIRKTNNVLVYGEYLCLNEADENLFVYKRWGNSDSYIVLLNFSDETQTTEHIDTDIKESHLVISNYNNNHSSNNLRPWEAQLRRSLI